MRAAIPVQCLTALAIASCSYPDPGDVGGGGTGGDGGTQSDANVPACEACQLLAVTPAAAMPGETITLEGTFAERVVVRFPGGAAVEATIAGNHRATAVVPNAATRGQLTVDGIAGSLRFDASPYALALHAAGFQASYIQADGARSAPLLTVPRSNTACVVIGNYVYAIAGSNPTGVLRNIERAQINADGTLGAFVPLVEPQLIKGRDTHAAVVIGSHLYVIGGHEAGIGLTSVEHAAIQPSGSFGSFENASGAQLIQGRIGPMAVVIGSWLYVLGGQSATTGSELASIERAPIQLDGTLGSFVLLNDVQLATPRAFAAAHVIGQYLYVIAGGGNGAVKKTVERAQIFGDGTLGPFAMVSTALLTERRSFGSAVIGGSLYVFGGRSLSGDLASVERSVIDETGSLGTFAVPPVTLETPRQSRASLLIGGWLYMFGGYGTQPLRTIERASINLSSDFAPLASESITLTPARLHAATHVIGHAVYVIGGVTSQGLTLGSIVRATVSDDGTLGAFSEVGSLTKPRSHAASAIIGRYLYVMGGKLGASGDTSVERAQILPDGTLGPFTALGGINFTEGRAGATAVVSGSSLYVIGGTDRMSIDRSPILADDTLGGFVADPTMLTGIRASATVALTRSRLWLIGGVGGFGATIAGYDYAPVASDGVIGGFMGTGDLHAGRGAHGSAVIGNAVYLFGGDSDGGPLSSIERAGMTADGLIGQFVVFDSGLAAVRGGNPKAIVTGDVVHVLGGSVATTESAPMN
ncbi:MAG: hypothetical protein AB7O24_32960 [Kofleriaceae bacterium]